MDTDKYKKIAERISSQNRVPLEDFDGFSPEEMYLLIHHPFSPDSPVQFSETIDSSELQKSPFFIVALELLSMILRQGGLKLTPKGNLQRKVVTDIYAKGFLIDSHIESGIIKLRKEEDWLFLHLVKIVLTLAKIIRPAKGKLVLLKKWEKVLEKQDYFKIFMEFLKSFMTDYNWAFCDLYADEYTGQIGCVYLLYLVKKYGNDFRGLNFYAEKYFKAFPMLRFNNRFDDFSARYDDATWALKTRFFERFAQPFGFVEIITEASEDYFNRRKEIKRTPLLDGLIEVK